MTANNSAGTPVYRFIGGATVETFQFDSDFVTGTITDKAFGKVRIVWDASKDGHEWVSAEYVTKVGGQYVYAEPVESDSATDATATVPAQSGNSDKAGMTREEIEMVANAVEKAQNDTKAAKSTK